MQWCTSVIPAFFFFFFLCFWRQGFFVQQPWLSCSGTHSEKSACLCIPSARLKDHHHKWIPAFLWCDGQRKEILLERLASLENEVWQKQETIPQQGGPTPECCPLIQTLWHTPVCMHTHTTNKIFLKEQTQKPSLKARKQKHSLKPYECFLPPWLPQEHPALADLRCLNTGWLNAMESFPGLETMGSRMSFQTLPLACQHTRSQE